MPSRQKAKGNNWERTVAKHLSDVFDSNFTRVPTSGAMTGGMNADVLARLTDNQKLLLEGDIIPPDHMYKMKIECKSLKKFSFAGMLSENKQLEDWIEQARGRDKIWFLIFKINNQGSYLCFTRNVFKTCDNLSDRNYLIYKKYYYVTPMDGFFEKYKANLLQLCKK
jgi:Holliday junction resolvase